MATTTSSHNIFTPQTPSYTTCSRHVDKRRNEVLEQLRETEQMMSIASTFQHTSSPFERESFTIIGSPSSDHYSFSFSLNPSTRNRDVPSDGVFVIWFTSLSLDLPVAVDVVDGEGRKIVHSFVDLEVSNGDQKLIVPIKAADVARWLEVGGTVELNVKATQGDLNLLKGSKDGEFASKKPILHIVTKRRSGRSKRSLIHINTCSQNDERCCLSDLIIDFKQLGYHHVIAPLKANVYVCAGQCKQENTPLHFTGAINRAGMINHSCCHVDETTSLRVVLISNENEITTLAVPGIIATHCVCT